MEHLVGAGGKQGQCRLDVSEPESSPEERAGAGVEGRGQSSGSRPRWWWHSLVNVLNAPELHTCSG